MRARLVSLEGNPPVELAKDLTLIGRDDDCDVRLDHRSVSKLHCVLVKSEGLLLLRDLGSTNGTRVNGQRVRRAALLPNDLLTIANLKYQVKFGADLDADVAAELRNAPANGTGEGGPNPGKAPLRLNPLPYVYPEQTTPSD
jgi:pSer/pThr/pTyr-binding forkhead associated (FHA) protein